MYPQPKFTGYERNVTQAWAPPQVSWPAALPSPNTGWGASAPLPLIANRPALQAYVPAAKGLGWFGTLGLMGVTFVSGLWARPAIEAQVRQTATPVWFFSAGLGSSFDDLVDATPLPEGPTLHALSGLTTSPLPTPRRAAASPHAAAAAQRAVASRAVTRAAVPSKPSPPVLRRVAKAEARLATRSPSAAPSPSPVVAADPVESAPAVVAPAVAAPSSAALLKEVAALTAVAPAPRSSGGAPDSLDSLMNHAVTAPAAGSARSAQRLRFPGEKAEEQAPIKTNPSAEAPKPDRITNDVTSAAAKAAKASASAAGPSGAPVALPNLPSRVRVSDDPLAGLNGKEIEGKRQLAAKPSRRR